MRALCCVMTMTLATAGWTADREDASKPPTRTGVEATMGLKNEGDLVRGQMDTVGFVVDGAQAEDVVASAIRLEQLSAHTTVETFVGGVCPHDDHLFASKVYVHLTERITAPRVILIGVFHRARDWHLRDRIVFDSFESWHGPWNPIRIDPLRDLLIKDLPEEMRVVDNAMHSREHSLEAIVPFLQRGRPDRTIVPILVPYMGWERMDEINRALAAAIVEIMDRDNLRLGRDLAIVVSSDAVHYGPDFDHAPFGTGSTGYEQAVARDRRLAADHLEGALEAEKLETLLETLVDPATLDYRLPWCGRFSIPFGLDLLRRVALATEGAAPEGSLLRYGTSLSESELPVSAATREAGLGYTAPSNLHHWVGYAAVGYSMPDG